MARKFKNGDTVFCSQYGVAILEKTTIQVIGENITCYLLKFIEAVDDTKKVYIPIKKIDEHVRSIISKEEAERILNLIKQKAVCPEEAWSFVKAKKSKSKNFKALQRVLNQVIIRGNAHELAYMVSFYRHQETNKMIPLTERDVYQAALHLLTAELAHALSKSHEEIYRDIDLKPSVIKSLFFTVF